MSTSNTDRRRTFTGDGTDNSPYSLATWPMRRDEDIELFAVTDATGVIARTYTISTDYTIAIAADYQSATITFDTGTPPTLPATGETLVIRRTSDFIHQENYQAHDGQPADILDADFDENMLQRLAVLEKTDRSIQVSTAHPDADLPLAQLNLIGNGEKLVSVLEDESGFELVANTDIEAVIGPDPAASTDNAIVRWDGTTGRLIQDSSVLIDDSDNITDAVNITGSGVISMAADTMSTHILGHAKIFAAVPDHTMFAHFDHATLAGHAFGQTETGLTTVNTPVGNEIHLSVGFTPKVDIRTSEVELQTGVDLTVSDGDIEVSGVITAGSGSNQITTAAGLIDHAMIDPAIAGAGITNTAGVLSVAEGAGDVTGPGPTVTSEAVAVYDGTGGLTIKETAVTMTVAGAIAGATTITASGNLTLTAGDLDVSGTITAGSGNNQITTTAGLLDHAKIDPAIAGTGIDEASGVLSVNADYDGNVRIEGASSPTAGDIPIAVTGTTLIYSGVQVILATDDLQGVNDLDMTGDLDVGGNATVEGFVYIEATTPRLYIRETDAAADGKDWTLQADSSVFRISARTDGGSGTDLLTASRTSGTNDITQVSLRTGNINAISIDSAQDVTFSADIEVDGDVNVQGGRVESGVNDSVQGDYIAYGSSTSGGGRNFWYNAASEDSTYSYHVLEANGDYIGFGTNLAPFNIRAYGNGNFYINGSYLVDGTQVVTDRQTGWAAPTGTADRTTFATGSVTLSELAERVHALIDDLTTHGLIGA